MIRILQQICIMFYHIPFTFSNNLFIFLSELFSNNFAVNLSLTLFKMGTLGVAHRWAGGKKAPLLKVCHTYPTIMTLCSYTLPKEDPKNISITWHIPWVLLTSTLFHQKSANFCYIKKYRYRLHFDTWFLILLFSIWRFFLINLVIVLMMSAKIATPGLFKITVF